MVYSCVSCYLFLFGHDTKLYLSSIQSYADGPRVWIYTCWYIVDVYFSCVIIIMLSRKLISMCHGRWRVSGIPIITLLFCYMKQFISVACLCVFAITEFGQGIFMRPLWIVLSFLTFVHIFSFLTSVFINSLPLT